MLYYLEVQTDYLHFDTQSLTLQFSQCEETIFMIGSNQFMLVPTKSAYFLCPTTFYGSF